MSVWQENQLFKQKINIVCFVIKSAIITFSKYFW